jgi:SAM-dependent methyltransferase
MIKLNLGSGVHAVAGWINVDKYLTEEGIRGKKGFYAKAIWEEGAEFIQADILKLPFPDEYADIVEMHEVLEHFALIDVVPALKEVYRVMKKGAKFIFNTPCFDGLALDWIKMTLYNKIKNQNEFDEYLRLAQTIYGNQAGDGEFHRTPFNVPFLNYCIVQAGFKEGTFLIYRKDLPIPPVGELGSRRTDAVLRNDTIVGELIK